MSRTLGHLPMINCASPDYLMRFGMPLRLEDLSQHAMVHYSQQLGSAHSGFEFFDGQRSHFIQTGGALTVNSTPAYRHACPAGLGIIQVPRHGVQALLENQRLVEVLPHFAPARCRCRCSGRIAATRAAGQGIYGVADAGDERHHHVTAQL